MPQQTGIYAQSGSRRGLPLVPALGLLAAGIALGIVVGRTTSEPPPPPAVAESIAPAPAAESPPASADPGLEQDFEICETEVELLEGELTDAHAEIDRLGGEAEAYRKGLRRAVDTLNEQARRHRRSDARKVRRAPPAQTRRAERPPDVRVWTTYIRPQALGDMLAEGKVHNLEQEPVRGTLEVELVTTAGRVQDRTKLDLLLEPGLNGWSHIFRSPPSDNYTTRVDWTPSF